MLRLGWGLPAVVVARMVSPQIRPRWPEKGAHRFLLPQASKPLTLLVSSPIFRSDFFLLSKPSTIVGPAAALLLLRLSTVDVSESKAPEAEGMRGAL